MNKLSVGSVYKCVQCEEHFVVNEREVCAIYDGNALIFSTGTEYNIYCPDWYKDDIFCSDCVVQIVKEEDINVK